jgi:hypothetical protein
MAVACLLIRLLNPGKRHRIFLWVLTIFSLICLLICFVIFMCQCDPPRAQWDFTIISKTCWAPWIVVDFTIYACGALRELTANYVRRDVNPGNSSFGLYRCVLGRLSVCGSLQTQNEAKEEGSTRCDIGSWIKVNKLKCVRLRGWLIPSLVPPLLLLSKSRLFLEFRAMILRVS